LHYNLISGVINRIFNNNIFINKDVELNIDDICGSLHTPKHKMFKVIDNYFSNNEYIISKDDNIDQNFKVIEKEDVLTGGNIYKHKYLKYKHKYLKYKQYLK
jgi:hypothetical protein